MMKRKLAALVMTGVLAAGLSVNVMAQENADSEVKVQLRNVNR